MVEVVDISEEQVDTREGSPDELVEPAAGPNVTSTLPYPRRIPEDESDDELDLFGSYHRKPTPQQTETIQEPATASPDPVIVDDDLADGEGDVDNEDGLEDGAFPSSEDIIIGQTDTDWDGVDQNQADETIDGDQMSIDEDDEPENHRQSPPPPPSSSPPPPPPPQFDDAGHFSDTSDEALSVTSKEVDDRMDTQPDLVPATLKAPVFAELRYPSEPLYLVSNKAPRPIFVLGPIAPLKAYNFGFDSEVSIPPTKEAELSPPATLLRSGPHAKYSLPPLKSLPAEYNRKNKSKQRKREKEREKNDAKRDSNDWTPVGLNKWAATINANPVWKKVSRATKCLSSREWAVSLPFF